MAKRKGKFGKFGPRKRKKKMAKINAMDVKNMGITRKIVLSSRRTITIGEDRKPISPEKWRKLKRRSPRKRK